MYSSTYRHRIAAIAVIYSLIVGLCIYREMTWKDVWNALGECIDTLSIVLILCGTSSIFGYCLTYLHVPDLAANAIIGFSESPIVIALLINAILLVLGCVMDMAPIILIATPILLPVATSIGITPIQFGIIMVLNCGIGLLTPPVGTCLFISSAISHLPIEKIAKQPSILSVHDSGTVASLHLFRDSLTLLPNLFMGYPYRTCRSVRLPGIHSTSFLRENDTGRRHWFPFPSGFLSPRSGFRRQARNARSEQLYFGRYSHFFPAL